MECPKCKSRSVIIKDGQKKCESKNCMYIEFHVITYENENRQFEGQKGTQNRFNSINYNSQNRDRDIQKYEKNFQVGEAVIKKLCTAMSLSNNIQDIAKSKLLQVLKVKYPEEKNGSEQKEKEREKDKKQQRLSVPDKQIGAYCLWLACCDKNMEFKDVRIANEMGITKTQWSEIHSKMENKFKLTMNIPASNPEQYIRRICRKRQIDDIEKDAMLEMAKNIRDAAIKGGKKNTTVAACIFWQIMIRSSRYNGDGQFDIKKYLQKGGRNNQDELSQKYWTQRQFDISFEAIRKFKNDQLGSQLQSFIPQFKTRKPYIDEKSKNYDDRNKN